LALSPFYETPLYAIDILWGSRQKSLFKNIYYFAFSLTLFLGSPTKDPNHKRANPQKTQKAKNPQKSQTTKESFTKDPKG